MEYDDVDVDAAKPLDRIFADHIMEFESGSNRISDRELKKMMRDLDDYETGCQTKRRRNRE